MEIFPNKNPDFWNDEDFVLAKILLHRAGCNCPNILVGYRPNVGPRCRLCDTVVDVENNIIVSDVEVFGYKSASFNNPTTDFSGSKGGERWCIYRVHIDMKKHLIIELGMGREIRIKFNSNKSNIS